MSLRRKTVRNLVPLAILFAAASSLPAQTVASDVAGNGGVTRAVLAGHMRPWAIAANDLGRVDASLTLHHVTLLFRQTPAQQADLAAFLTDQQDPASPDFHHWLTPEQYGARFGLAQSEIDYITSWLASQNLTVDSVGRGLTTLAFSGLVRDVESTFGAEIHYYNVDGVKHFANASEPSVPSALAGLIQVMHGLDDFRLRPMAVKALNPSYTSLITGNHFLAPDDVATIFDIAPLYNSGITGKGQTIVVVGQTQINLSDIGEFRTYFNLSANDPQLVEVPRTTNPGISSNDLPEADLDLEWSGAIARDASIVFVYSDDVQTSVGYAINENLAPVITMSYGECEPLSGNADLTLLNSYAQQANAQGITWISSAGDNGANGCFGGSSRPPSGLSVIAPASVPGVTGVGGTTLNEGNGTYWNATNNSNHASALSYIPEVVWNDSVANGSPDAGGGGASVFFAKPVWQTGPGVPSDGQRDVPDISLPASNFHDGYLVYTSGTLEAFGGTSVGTPVFAGMTALLNQYLVANGLEKTAGLGNVNPRLYTLAQISPGAFHDVTIGNNMVVDCASAACATDLVGFNAGPNYDQASGLGSVDAFNLISAWPQTGAAAKVPATLQLTSGQTFLQPTDSTTLTASVTTTSGATPAGMVAFYVGGISIGSAELTGSGLTATATLTATASQLSAGSPEAAAYTDPSTNASLPTVAPQISVIYSGDGAYASASATQTVYVSSPSTMVLSSLLSAASFQRNFSPGMIVAAFGLNLATSTPATPGSPLPTQLAGTTVTLNGTPVPLYYVSPTQINLQIPWEISANTSAIVKVAANGQTATFQLPIYPSAPEVFADANSLLVPYQTTGRGDTIYLFETGDGLFTTPAVTTGSVPAAGNLSTTVSNVSITVGGVPATATYVGVPTWSIGVTQINFTIPPTAPLGLQPVVVTTGGVSSAPVLITVAP